VKRKFEHVLVALLLSLSYLNVSAQAPSISYSPTANVFTVGSAITALTPANSGGAVPANTYSTVSTFAGTGTAGTTNGAIASARFSSPRWATIDYTNKLMYVADAGNNEIRKIDLVANTVSLYAGTGTGSETNGAIASATFNAPYAITYDGSGALYVADFTGNTIRKIVVATGIVSTIASGLNAPAGIVYDPVSTSLYVCNSGANTILKMSTTGAYSVYAGSGTAALTDGTGTAAAFSLPNGIAVDASGNIYVADQSNNAIRKIVTGGVVTTFATGFNAPRGVDVDISGNLYVSDNGNLIYLVSPGGTVTTIAGNGTAALLNGVGTSTEFNQSRGVCVYKTTGDIYVSDYSNNVIRKIIGTGYLIAPTTLPTGLTFTSTSGKISGTPTATFSTTDYTITAFNVSGVDTAAISIQCVQTNNWTAAANSTSWTTTGNWSAGTVPGANDNVQIGVIAYSRNRQPTISGSTAVNSITFGTNNTPALTISGSTLTVSSGITVNTGSVITITGGTTGAIAMAPGSAINLNGTGKLALTFASGKFTLQSDATGSASFGQILTPANLTGSALSNISVERYVTGGSSTYRGYRLLSSPVYAATVSGNNVYNLDYIKSSALITGVSTANGFDRAGNPSLFLFREDIAPSFTTYGAGNWPGVSKINGSPTYNLQLNSVASNYSLMAGSGFLFFFRGDRTTNLANKYTAGTSAESVTFTATGTLTVGQVVAKDWYTSGSSNLGFTSATANSAVRGFNLVGNPYPSNIDWDTYQVSTSSTGIYGVNIDSTMYMLDPISKNYGAYIAGNNQLGTNNVTNIIPSGAGFFVRATTTNPQLIFNESAKTTTQAIGAHIMLGIPVASASLQYMRIKMIKDSVSTDETMIRIKSNGAMNFVNKLDAVYKQGNGAVNLASFTSDKVDIAIKSVPLPKLQAESLALDVNATTTGIYKLTLRDIVAIPRLYDVWLMDAYKKDSLDMRQNITYSFYIDKADSSTFGNKRFNLVIRQNAAYAYHLLDFTANKLQDAKQVQVLWKTQNEGNYTNFTVERSTDNGATFKILGGVDAAGAGSYSFIDKSPVNGTNLYRLKQEDVNNAISYSRIVTIQYSNLSNGIVGRNLSIYPNPAISNINLAIASQNSTASVYNIRFMSSSGIMVKEATSSEANWQGSISNLQPGTYIIQVFDNKTQNLVGENKFVKL
jgi:sugar lactone lactonase YvrE